MPLRTGCIDQITRFQLILFQKTSCTFANKKGHYKGKNKLSVKWAGGEKHNKSYIFLPYVCGILSIAK